MVRRPPFARAPHERPAAGSRASRGPADRTQIVSSYIFTQAFKRLDFGYASAIALVLLIMLLAYSMLIILLRQTLLNKG